MTAQPITTYPNDQPSVAKQGQDLQSLMTLSECEKQEELSFLRYCIAKNDQSIVGCERHARLARTHGTRELWQGRAESLRGKNAWINSQIVALTTDRDVTFVRVSGMRLAGVVCEKCGEPVQNGYTPVTLSRRSGVWHLEDFICYDQKFTTALPQRMTQAQAV